MKTRRPTWRCYILAGALPVLLLAAGCGRSVSRLERMEESDPALRRARARQNAQDIDGAIDLYNRALERKPDLARAHLDVGLLYDGHKEDFIRAIYHYQRYLELRPDAEKRQLVEDMVRRARMAYAISLSDPPASDELVIEIRELRQENEALKARLAETVRRYEERLQEAQADPAAASRPTERAAAERDPAPLLRPVAEPLPAVRTYRVQRGDTLSSIAARKYSDATQWRKIYDANRQTLKSPSSLDVGQTLVIPP